MPTGNQQIGKSTNRQIGKSQVKKAGDWPTNPAPTIVNRAHTNRGASSIVNRKLSYETRSEFDFRLVTRDYGG
jgi:hypothetical protein